jgi:hypothetical protein
MKVLAPLLTGRESSPEYIEAITSKVDNIILLQIIDKEFMRKTSAAMSEVMHFHSLMDEMKKLVGAKRKSYVEVTEWGKTTQKIASLAILQNVDKVIFVSQKNKFFEEILDILKKEKIKYDVVIVSSSNEKRK